MGDDVVIEWNDRLLWCVLDYFVCWVFELMFVDMVCNCGVCDRGL